MPRYHGFGFDWILMSDRLETTVIRVVPRFFVPEAIYIASGIFFADSFISKNTERNVI